MDTHTLNSQLGDLTWCISTGMLAGYSLRQVFEAIAAQAPEPTSGIFKGLLAELDRGMSLESALNQLKQNSPSPAFTRLVDVILTHRQIGGNLAYQLEPVMEEFLATEGSDPAFYAMMREEAQILGASLPERAK